jgi:diguanylate cyclase (GGDEF)-like protein/PAS domain S-box-containing protein
MQGPVVDAVLLLLLILFFGLQQRNRPQSYFRFWFVGWILVFASYAVWDIRVASPLWSKVQDAGDFDFVLAGCTMFLMSMVSEQPAFLENALLFSAVSLVNVLIIDTREFTTVPKLVLMLAIVSWQICGFICARAVIPKTWRRARLLVLTICVVYGVAIVTYLATTSGKDLDNWAVVQLLLVTAVLYGGMSRGRSIAGSLGVVGFASWAVFYFVNMLRPEPSPMQTLMYDFWNFPKYFVGLSMILKVFEDATEEKEQIGAQFRELYEDFRLIYDTHPHPMWICDGITGRFLTANAATLKTYGYSLQELRQMCMDELVQPMDADAEEFVRELETVEVGGRLRHRYKDGRVVWVSVSDREIRYLGRLERLVMAQDVTEQMKLDQELSHRAQHDVLTGLANRQLLADRMEQSLLQSDKEERKVAILTIDVDHFKLINDTYGHLVGDECLKVVAARLKSKIRKADTIARTGGEEFMAVVSGLSQAADAEKVAASLLRVFDAPLDLSVGDMRVTVSVGVAVYPDDATDADTLRRLSDEALYRAKRAGRNCAGYACDAQVQSWAV